MQFFLDNHFVAIFLLWLPIHCALYWVHQKPAPKDFSSHFFLHKILEKRTNRPFAGIFQHWLLFCLQLGGIFLIFLALSHPRLGQEKNLPMVSLVFDTSASMNAKQGGQTRLHHSLAEAARLIREGKFQVDRIFTFEQKATPIEQSSWSVALLQIKAGHLSLDFEALSAWIRQEIREGRQVLFFTDSLNETEKLVLSALKAGFACTASSASNCFIHGIKESRRPPSIHMSVNVQCSGSFGQSAVLMQSHSGRKQVDFQASSNTSIDFDLQAGDREHEIGFQIQVEGDELEADNFMFVPAGRTTLRIALDGFNTQDPAFLLLQKWIHSDSDRELNHQNYDLKFKQTNRLEAPVAGEIQWLKPADEREYSDSFFIDPAHSWLKFLDGKRFSPAQEIELSKNETLIWNVLACAESTSKPLPVILAHQPLSAALNILVPEDISSQLSLFLLLENIIQDFTSSLNLKRILTAGTQIKDQKLDQSGLYNLPEGQVFVRISEKESLLKQGGGQSLPPWEHKKQGSTQSLLVPLLLSALLFLCLEWFIWLRNL